MKTKVDFWRNLSGWARRAPARPVESLPWALERRILADWRRTRPLHYEAMWARLALRGFWASLGLTCLSLVLQSQPEASLWYEAMAELDTWVVWTLSGGVL